MLTFSDDDRRAFRTLLTPSWLSGLLIIMVSLALSIGLVILFAVNNSLLQQQVLSWEQTQPQPALTQPGQTLPEDDHPTLAGDWALLLLWSVVGLLVYALVATILHSVGQARELRESLNYVNARPETVLVTTAKHALLRLMGVVVAVVFGLFLVKKILPYCITVSHASAANFFSPGGILYVLLSFGLIAVGLHLETIFLRLAFGRARIVGNSLI